MFPGCQLYNLTMAALRILPNTDEPGSIVGSNEYRWNPIARLFLRRPCEGKSTGPRPSSYQSPKLDRLNHRLQDLCDHRDNPAHAQVRRFWTVEVDAE
jgi:hypothetical protein